jgi:hypothetical protein
VWRTASPRGASWVVTLLADMIATQVHTLDQTSAKPFAKMLTKLLTLVGPYYGRYSPLEFLHVVPPQRPAHQQPPQCSSTGSQLGSNRGCVEATWSSNAPHFEFLAVPVRSPRCRWGRCPAGTGDYSPAHQPRVEGEITQLYRFRVCVGVLGGPFGYQHSICRPSSDERADG